MSGLTDPGRPRNRVLAGVGLSVLDFAPVFTLYGAAFGAIGSWLLRHTSGLRLLPRPGHPVRVDGTGPGVGQFGPLALVRSHIRIVNFARASMLIILALLMVTGVWVRGIYQLPNLSGTFLTPSDTREAACSSY